MRSARQASRWPQTWPETHPTVKRRDLRARLWLGIFALSQQDGSDPKGLKAVPSHRLRLAAYGSCRGRSRFLGIDEALNHVVVSVLCPAGDLFGVRGVQGGRTWLRHTRVQGTQVIRPVRSRGKANARSCAHKERLRRMRGLHTACYSDIRHGRKGDCGAGPFSGTGWRTVVTT